MASAPRTSSQHRLLLAGIGTPTKELEDALREFQDALPPKTKRELEDLVANDDVLQDNAAIRLIAAAEKQNARTLGYRTMSRIQGFLESVQVFSSVVDNFATLNPIAAIVWSAIKAFIFVTVRFTSFFADLVDCLNSAQRCCPRFADYLLLYKDCEPLQKALCSYYVVVFDFCTAAVQALHPKGFWLHVKDLGKDFFRKQFPDLGDQLKNAGNEVEGWIIFARDSANEKRQAEMLDLTKQKRAHLVKQNDAESRARDRAAKS